MVETEEFLVVTPKDPIYEDPNVLGRLKQHLEDAIPGKRFLVAFEPLIATQDSTFVVVPFVDEINNVSGQKHNNNPNDSHRRMAWLIMGVLDTFQAHERHPTVH